MKRLIRQLKWRWILIGALLIIGRFTLVWAGNVSTSIQDTGTNVGIGTTTPAQALDVNGVIQAFTTVQSSPGADLRLNAGSANRDIFFQVNGVTYITMQGSTGRLGVGTTNPGAAFEVSGNTISIDGIWMMEAGGQLTTVPGNDVNIGVPSSRSLLVKLGGVTKITMDNQGNVGIGTTSPTTKLHVAGDAQVDGNLAAKYQDVAEWVKASSSLPPGTVVVVDPQGHNQILLASQSYDTRVAGVVSTRPGLLLGEAGSDKVKVAQSGRVKVKVDAAYGPIAAGDLLVTSPSPGHAMRSSPVKLGETLIHRPGTLLGKALEPLEEGQGEILVLLTLQ